MRPMQGATRAPLTGEKGTVAALGKTAGYVKGGVAVTALALVLAALGAVGGEEALKGEPPGIQPRHRQGGDGGAAAGDGLHGDAALGAELYQIRAGVGDGGGARVGDQGAGLAP